MPKLHVHRRRDTPELCEQIEVLAEVHAGEVLENDVDMLRPLPAHELHSALGPSLADDGQPRGDDLLAWVRTTSAPDEAGALEILASYDIVPTKVTSRPMVWVL